MLYHEAWNFATKLWSYQKRNYERCILIFNLQLKKWHCWILFKMLIITSVNLFMMASPVITNNSFSGLSSYHIFTDDTISWKHHIIMQSDLASLHNIIAELALTHRTCIDTHGTIFKVCAESAQFVFQVYQRNLPVYPHDAVCKENTMIFPFKTDCFPSPCLFRLR